ncbi:hypothetical protein KEM48_009613 [Puccinia striiformis f. sp. tritici PST-130]|nr:hypothetical protein KEM48_009613 [Puccinia striiformis f. sp. tritici PST-130]
MELMGVKMLGIQNPGVGKAFYSHVRMVMTIMKLHLPAWEASQPQELGSNLCWIELLVTRPYRSLKTLDKTH